MARRNVINVDEVDARTTETGTKFGARARGLARPAGSEQLGCTHYEVPPGRAAFPKHFHCTTEEAVFVLAGDGVLKVGDEEVPLRAGDYVALPCGPKAAHQIVNRGAATLSYLCFSTKPKADVVVYPDSKKFAVVATDDPDAFKNGNYWIREIRSLADGKLAYFDGEDVG